MNNVSDLPSGFCLAAVFFLSCAPPARNAEVAILCRLLLHQADFGVLEFAVVLGLRVFMAWLTISLSHHVHINESTKS